jgi:Transposase IS4
VHFDNYYTSIPLFLELDNMRILANGTVRTNRKGLCKKVTITKGEERQLKANPGFTRYASCGKLTYVAWFDKRPVHMLSNCYQPWAEDSVVQHWFPAKKGEESQSINGKVLKEISIPPAVSGHNKHMGGVDRFDQYRSHLKLEVRSRKFWHPMFWFIIEAALVNSWVLYKCTCELAGMTLKYTHFTFRKSITLALAAEWESMKCTNRPKIEPGSPNTIMKTASQKQVRVHLKQVIKENRFSTPDRHIAYLEKIPVKEGWKKNFRQLLSQQCKTHLTSKWCRSCAAPLCVGKCFSQYHSNPDL